MNELNSLFEKIKSDAKMIMLDLDGTLIGHRGEVDMALRDALLTVRAHRPDLLLVVNTGRPFGGIATKTAALLADPHTPHVFHGGALVRSMDEVIHAEAIDKADVHALLDQHATYPAFSLELYSTHTIYVAERGPLDRAHGEVLGMPHTVTDLRALTESEPLIKAQWILPAEGLDALRPSYLESCAYAEATSDVMPEAAFVTVTRQGVDKGSATRALLDRVGISPDEVVAIGDSRGDLPMLDAVKFPFIMRNAPAALHSRYPVLPHIDQKGIIPLLEALT